MTQPNTIRKLSDSALLKRLNTLAERERVTTLEILLHLSEVDRRELYLAQGFSSLFAYCTGHLGFSESAAGRRVRAARCTGKHPEICALLRTNEVNISTVSKIAGFIDGKNKRALLNAIRGKSQREVDRVVAWYQPGRRIRDRVRPVAILKTVSWDAALESDSSSALSPGVSSVVGPLSSHDLAPAHSHVRLQERQASHARIRTKAFGKWQEIYRRSGGKKLATAGNNAAAGNGGETPTANDTSNTRKQTIVEQKFELKFAVRPEFMKKLDEVKALLSNRYPTGIEFEQLFGVLLDEFIDRHSPRKKQERREKRKTKRANAGIAGKTNVKSAGNEKTNATQRSKSRPGKPRQATNPPNKRTRYIPPATRDRVYTRDDGTCTYVGANGRRCNSTWGLQIDHIKPYARGGANRVDNPRPLCGKHNRFAAERIYGKGLTGRRRRRG